MYAIVYVVINLIIVIYLNRGECMYTLIITGPKQL